MLYAMAWPLERALNEPLQAELLAILESDAWTRVLIQNEGADRVRYLGVRRPRLARRRASTSSARFNAKRKGASRRLGGCLGRRHSSSESGSEDRALELAYARFSGGRLIFTNLNPALFPQRGAGRGAVDDFAPDIDLIYKVIQDPRVSITQAAALNADFPPVLSNIGLWELEDRAPTKKYYVTGGGVEGNRGLISLLFALEGALDRWPRDPKTALPCIHIAALGASALDFDYTQDRGIGAVFSANAGERLASGLERQLLEDIEGKAQSLGGGCPETAGGMAALPVRLHYLVLPAVFTTRGGFETHWLLPDGMRLHSPADAEPSHVGDFPEYRDLDRCEVQYLLFRCMFPAVNEPDGGCRKLFGRIPREWLGDTESCSSEPTVPPCVDGWRALCEELRNAPAH
jgi:hypothetical protein